MWGAHLSFQGHLYMYSHVCISSQTSVLTSRCVYPVAYWASLCGCVMGTLTWPLGSTPLLLSCNLLHPHLPLFPLANSSGQSLQSPLTALVPLSITSHPPANMPAFLSKNIWVLTTFSLPHLSPLRFEHNHLSRGLWQDPPNKPWGLHLCLSSLCSA